MYWLILIFVFVLSIETILLLVKRKNEQQKKKRQEQILLLAEELLSRQIRILENGDFQTMTMELEIARYLKSCIIRNIANGYFDEIDIWHAHKWIQDEFKEILESTAEGELPKRQRREYIQRAKYYKMLWNSKDIPRGKIGEGMSFEGKQKLLEAALRQDREKSEL